MMPLETDDAERPSSVQSSSKRSSSVRRFFLEHWENESETSLFLLVSLLDFFCTYLLLMSNGGGVRFVESNPVAAWFLNHYGPVRGLLGFKLAVVLVVICLSQIIGYQRPRTARAILLLAIALTGGVVVYSVLLLTRSMAI